MIYRQQFFWCNEIIVLIQSSQIVVNMLHQWIFLKQFLRWTSLRCCEKKKNHWDNESAEHEEHSFSPDDCEGGVLLFSALRMKTGSTGSMHCQREVLTRSRQKEEQTDKAAQTCLVMFPEQLIYPEAESRNTPWASC